MGGLLHNATVVDVLRSTEGALLLAPFLLAPGYVAGWLTNVLDFRRRSLAGQALISTPLAVAYMPLLACFLGRRPGFLWAAAAAMGAAFVVLGGRQAWRERLCRPSRATWIALALALGWALLVLAMVCDLQWRQRLYFSVPAYDYCVRTAFTAAAARHIPPLNPFFAGSPPVPLRYHYFWMLLCSLPLRLAGIAPRYGLYGGTIWAGIALMSVLALFVQLFAGPTERLRRKVLVAFALLAVTGLDLLPTLYLYLRHRWVFPDMEWWNVQITSWVDAMLWTPHHIAALVACLMGFLVLRQPAARMRNRAVNVSVAGVAFAGSFGLSTLVTFTFAVFMVLWVLISLRRQWWSEAVLALAAGGLALVLALPLLHALLPGDMAGHGASPFEFAIRKFSLVSGSGPYTELLLALLLPLNYGLELGFFLLVALLKLRAHWRQPTPLSRNQTAAWTMVATSFLIGSFVRSTTLNTNDLGWRCFLPAQFVFLLWAAGMVDGQLAMGNWRWAMFPRPRREGTTPASSKVVDREWKITRLKIFAALLLALGALATLYQVVNLRLYPILFDTGKIRPSPGWLDRDGELGARAFALRAVYDRLWATLPQDAMVQYDPLQPEYIPHLLYSGHDAPVGQPLCGFVFGGDIRRCKPRVDAIVSLFVIPSPRDAERLDDVCRVYGIDVMIVEDRDTVWKQPTSWVWRRPPLLANDYVRAFRCGKQ
jgi:hypothetical protein